MTPISFRDSLVAQTGRYAVQLILDNREQFELLADPDLKIRSTSVKREGNNFVFFAELAQDKTIKVFLVKRRVCKDTNSELDDRWFPAFAKIEIELEEQFLILYFSPKDIHAYNAPPMILGCTIVQRGTLSGKRLANIEPNRKGNPKIWLI